MPRAAQLGKCLAAELVVEGSPLPQCSRGAWARASWKGECAKKQTWRLQWLPSVHSCVRYLEGCRLRSYTAVRVRALHALQHADEYICIAAALGIARKPCDGVEVMHITVALHNKTQTCVYACSRTVPKESLMRMQPYMLGMNVNDHHLQHASLALCITG